VRYAWIRDHSDEFPKAVLFRALGVSSSGYYDWANRKPSLQRQRRDELAAMAKNIHAASNRVYGYRKVHEEMAEAWKVTCCRETIRKIMRENGLRSKVARPFVVTTDSNHELVIHSNILDRDFTSEAPDRKWVGDITYIRTLEGWLYLAAVMDLYSRRIVGWAMSEHIDARLVCDAFAMAVEHRHPGSGLLHHSDRGVQYASDKFQEMLDGIDARCSMSRKGNCWDNACVESFFGKLKTEQISKTIYPTRAGARQDVFWYIEVFYNRKRRHASLGYMSPSAFEAQHGNRQTG